MKLVVDNTDTTVTDLQVRNVADIVQMADAFADDVENGEYGLVRRVLVVVDGDQGLCMLGWGESLSPFEAMGLYDAAKMTTFADYINGD